MARNERKYPGTLTLAKLQSALEEHEQLFGELTKLEALLGSTIATYNDHDNGIRPLQSLALLPRTRDQARSVPTNFTHLFDGDATVVGAVMALSVYRTDSPAARDRVARSKPSMPAAPGSYDRGPPPDAAPAQAATPGPTGSPPTVSPAGAMPDAASASTDSTNSRPAGAAGESAAPPRGKRRRVATREMKSVSRSGGGHEPEPRWPAPESDREVVRPAHPGSASLTIPPRLPAAHNAPEPDFDWETPAQYAPSPAARGRGWLSGFSIRRIREALRRSPPDAEYAGRDRSARPSAQPAPATAAVESAEPEEISCNVAASLPESPPLDRPADLEIIVSREGVEQAAGRDYAVGAVRVSASRPLRVRVTARYNCAIDGPIEEEFDAPEVGVPATFVFHLRGLAAGQAEVWVDVFQGARRLTRLVLQPIFVAGVLQASAAVHSADVDPPLVDLRIYEESGPNDRWRLRFIVRSPELGLDNEYRTDEFTIDKTAYIADLYAKLEESWADTRGEFEPLMLSIRAEGVTLFRSLFPAPLQRLIWDHREQIGSLQVFAYEPSIPWEVMHVVEPEVPVPLSGGTFLAELGLTRWMSNVGIAPARLSLREGKARYCIPDYLDPELRLDSLAAESDMVRRLLGAEEVEAHKRPVLVALAREDDTEFDVLHFACHGSADPDRIWDSGVLLAGFERNGEIAREELSVNDIRTYANLRSSSVRPIIFLNACQTGVGGYSLSGAGGLAQAFVERGAGLFVGTLWSVGDSTALGFSTAFYDALKEGRSVTQAVRIARERAKQDGESTWLAYTVYGHPYARVS